MRDPILSSVLVLAAMAAAGFAMMALAWRGLARLVPVAYQVPYVVSGGLGGLGLVGMAAGAVTIQCRRERAARHRLHIVRITRAAEEASAAAQRLQGAKGR